MHAIEPLTPTQRAPMIRTQSHQHLSLAECDWPFQTALDTANRWVTLGNCIPWDELAEAYYEGLSSTQGRPTKDARLVIGAVIIKHRFCLSDRETVAQIQENPSLQYFVGLPGYQMEAPFAPSLCVEIRTRMGQSLCDVLYGAVIDAVDSTAQKTVTPTPTKAVPSGDDEPPPPAPEQASESADSEPTHRGKVLLDATGAPQAIRFPTDLSLLNEARELCEQIIDLLYADSGLTRKPRTCRQKARTASLGSVKRKRPGAKLIRRGIKQQVQYLRRTLGHIDALLTQYDEAGTRYPLPWWLLHRYWVIQHLYEQQVMMYRDRVKRCDDRSVSISQPYVRPSVRGTVDRPTEFGATLSVSLTAEGVYPEAVLCDTIYGSRYNREYLRDRGIRCAGKPLGRPKHVTEENRAELKRPAAQRREEYLHRIPIEGKFGQGKNGYQLNSIRAKRADTSQAWINSIFMVMNLLILLEVLYWLWKKACIGAGDWYSQLVRTCIGHWRMCVDQQRSQI